MIPNGGIYLGVFTPVEASGVGALLTAVIALVGRLMPLHQLLPCSSNPRATAMLFMIVIGASVFGPFLSLSRIPNAVSEAMAGLSFGVTGTLIVILGVMVVLGTFLETFSMLVIAMPIFFPIIVKLGIDPIWLGGLVERRGTDFGFNTIVVEDCC